MKTIILIAVMALFTTNTFAKPVECKKCTKHCHPTCKPKCDGPVKCQAK